DRQNVSASKSFGIRALLLRITDRRHVTLEHAGKQAAKRYAKRLERREERFIFLPRFLADVDDWHVDGVSALDGGHLTASFPLWLRPIGLAFAPLMYFMASPYRARIRSAHDRLFGLPAHIPKDQWCRNPNRCTAQ